jgi:hypothetical protein
VPFRPQPQGLGPGPNEPCPCGSGVSSIGCHADVAAGGWVLPRYQPLLTDERTGTSVPGCYAAFMHDYRPPLSAEHWLSENILRAASGDGPVRLFGLSWSPDREVELFPRSVAHKVLCERHNHALSRLDATAGAAFAALRSYQRDLDAVTGPQGSEFLLVSGEELERWLLKLLWGVTTAKMIVSQGQTVSRLRADIALNLFGDYLFRDGVLPEGWGFHAIGRPDTSVHAVAEIAVSLQTDHTGGLTLGTADMGTVSMGFSLGPLAAGSDGDVRPRTSALCLTDISGVVQKVLALGWDRPPTSPSVWRRVGQVDLGAAGLDPRRR